MASTLDEIRRKLREKENKFGSGSNGSANEVYPFWNIPEGSTATIRFLPDGDPNNTFFWVERLIIKLPFEGVVGHDDSKPVVVQVPCVEMWGKTCPILSEVRAWFKDPDLEATGRKYWKKRSYVFQGFVVNNPMDEQAPENPIRRFVINKTIYETIRASLMDAEMEEIPTDYAAGRDFKLTKTKRGQYADYSTSAWSMRTRALTDNELEAINKYGLFDLKEYLPKEPGSKELEIIKEMFEASVNGELYDESRWGSYYKPAGFTASENKSTVSIPATTTADVDEEDEPAPAPKAAKPAPSNALSKLKAAAAKVVDDEVEEAADSTKPDPSQILEMIKQRRANKS
jgi:hypothetical protein